jgi:hypothetical protein
MMDDGGAGSSHQILDTDVTMDTDCAGWRIRCTFSHDTAGTSYINGFKVEWHEE